MRTLILGGTGFVGAATADAAVARGDDVTVLNRGLRTAPPDGATALVGDRTAPDGLAALSGVWDLVVDTWSGAPSVVAASAAALADSAARYAYVSSRSVYAWPIAAGAAEDAPVVAADPDAGQTDYAADKRGGERAVLRAFGADRSLLARAGLILGPREDVGRLPWWLSRIARGGRVLAPGPAELPLQYVDARDLADLLLSTDATGPLNTVSAPGHTTMGELLQACRTATGADAELVWVPPEVILDAGIAPWTELPVWMAPDTEGMALHTGDTTRAAAAGLRCRPVAETVADTWDWLQTAGYAPRADRPAPGLDAAKEADVLGAWDAEQN